MPRREKLLGKPPILSKKSEVRMGFNVALMVCVCIYIMGKPTDAGGFICPMDLPSNHGHVIGFAY